MRRPTSRGTKHRVKSAPRVKRLVCRTHELQTLLPYFVVFGAVGVAASLVLGGNLTRSAIEAGIGMAVWTGVAFLAIRSERKKISKALAIPPATERETLSRSRTRVRNEMVPSAVILLIAFPAFDGDITFIAVGYLVAAAAWQRHSRWLLQKEKTDALIIWRERRIFGRGAPRFFAAPLEPPTPSRG